MEQQIRFCTNRNGVRIAYSTMGSGPPVVFVPGWTSHLEQGLESPRSGPMFRTLAEYFTLVRYDKGGTGLSQRGLGHYTLDSRLADVEAVVDALHLRKFGMWASSEGGPIGIAYAVRHPRHLTRLVLYGTYARGSEMGRPDVQQALLTTVRASWGMGSDTMTNLFIRGASPEDVAAMVRSMRISATKEDAAALLEAVYESDVADLLPKVKAPTLVIHVRGDRAVPYRNGLEVVGGIPGARLFTVESNQHAGTDALNAATKEGIAFLLEGSEPATALPAPAPSGLLTVLFTDMVGSTSLTRELGDAKAQHILHEHNAIVRTALEDRGGHEVKHTGDGIMASFPTASSAIDAALAIQEAVEQSPARGLLSVRVGMNAGEPVAENDDLFGGTVQMAARVCAEAAPGTVLVSNVVRELAMGKGYRFSEQEPKPLKGFDDPVRLFEVRRG